MSTRLYLSALAFADGVAVEGQPVHVNLAIADAQELGAGEGTVPGQYVLSRPRKAGGLEFIAYDPAPPVGVVFAYQRSAQQFETFKSWYAPTGAANINRQPNLVGCLDQGILLYKAPNGALNVEPQPNDQHRGWLLPVRDANYDPIAVPCTVTDSATIEGKTHPVKKLEGKAVAIDQPRVLLVFLQMLDELLRYKTINPNISFTNEYFNQLPLAGLL